MKELARLPIPQEITDIVSEMVAEAIVQAEIVEGFTVETEEDARIAAEQLRALAKFRKQFDQRRLDSTAPYRALSSDINDAFNEPLGKAKDAEDELRKRLSAWQQEQERIAAERRREEERKLAEERRIAAEAAERERKRMESLKTPEALAKAADRVEAAESRVSELDVTAPAVQEAPKLAGFGLRDNWKPSFATDALKQLVKAAATDDTLLMYLELNVKQINSVVRTMRENAKIPGVTPVNDRTSTVR